MRDVKGRTALITGAANGIGRATAHALALEGMRLILCDRDEAGLQAVKAELPPPGTCLMAATLDVTDRAAMAALADHVHALVPALDVLVNNAGVGLAGGIAETTLEDWDWVLGVNLGGVVNGCHYFAPAMVKAGRGHIVNVSSALGYFATPAMLGYVTSKFAVFGLSESLRAELAPLGVGVSVICPGVIATNMVRQTRFRVPGDAEAMKVKADRLYQRRNYGPDRVAAAIVRAVRANRAVVPVSPEAWLLYYLSRLSPALAAPFGRWVIKQALP